MSFGLLAHGYVTYGDQGGLAQEPTITEKLRTTNEDQIVKLSLETDVGATFKTKNKITGRTVA